MVVSHFFELWVVGVGDVFCFLELAHMVQIRVGG